MLSARPPEPGIDQDAKAPPTRLAVLTVPELHRRLAHETERALRYQRPLAVVAIDLGDLEGGARASAVDAVARELRQVDVIGWDGGAEILAILPETASAATTPADRIVRALALIAPRARAGVAAFPDDGISAGTLLERAREAARGAPAGEVARAAESASLFTLGGRAVLAADPAMKRLFALVEQLARSDIPVLVRGESGVGKEIVATALHAWSPRNRRRMVAINCAAIPDALFESELFGHERGAFSGAAAAKAGLLEAADGGTLFLDEIGECSPHHQAKLLRVLETQRVIRLGSVIERAVDVRLVAASNRSLEADVAAGRFRQDLFFRLGAAVVEIAPLRERALDLQALPRAFLDEACARLGRPPPHLSPEAARRLGAHAWPGNVRELRNAMDFIAATCGEATVEPHHLPARIFGSRPPPGCDRELPREPGRQGEAPRNVTRARPEAGGAAAAPRRFRKVHDELCELERTRMCEALEEAGGVRMRAAELIGMPLRTFVTKLREYAITAPVARRSGHARGRSRATPASPRSQPPGRS